MGFDTIELNVGSLEIPEETFLRFVRLVKSGGLKAKPECHYGEAELSAPCCTTPRLSSILKIVNLG